MTDDSIVRKQIPFHDSKSHTCQALSIEGHQRGMVCLITAKYFGRGHATIQNDVWKQELAAAVIHQSKDVIGHLVLLGLTRLSHDVLNIDLCGSGFQNCLDHLSHEQIRDETCE